MRKYLQNNMNLLEDYCTKEGLSVKKIMSSPVCYNRNMMAVQYYDPKKTGEGLRNNTPAKILLIIERTEEGLTFLQNEDTKKFLS